MSEEEKKEEIDDEESWDWMEAEEKKKNTVFRCSFDEVREKIQDRVRIDDLVFVDSRNVAECPFKGNTPPNKSFRYYPETESWNCFHPDCGGGDVINLYASLNNLTYGEAIKEMCEKYNIEYVFTERTEEEIKTEEKVRKTHQEFAELCFRNLYDNREMYDGIKSKRGFTDETMAKFKIGLFDDGIKEYMEEKFGKEVLFEAGFLGKKKHNWIMGKRVVYPYLNQSGKPIYFIFRLIDAEPDFASHAKYIKLAVSEVVKEDG